jgi:hypothetical protein
MSANAALPDLLALFTPLFEQCGRLGPCGSDARRG